MKRLFTLIMIISLLGLASAPARAQLTGGAPQAPVVTAPTAVADANFFSSIINSLSEGLASVLSNISGLISTLVGTSDTEAVKVAATTTTTTTRLSSTSTLANIPTVSATITPVITTTTTAPAAKITTAPTTTVTAAPAPAATIAAAPITAPTAADYDLGYDKIDVPARVTTTTTTTAPTISTTSTSSTSGLVRASGTVTTASSEAPTVATRTTTSTVSPAEAPVVESVRTETAAPFIANYTTAPVYTTTTTTPTATVAQRSAATVTPASPETTARVVDDAAILEERRRLAAEMAAREAATQEVTVTREAAATLPERATESDAALLEERRRLAAELVARETVAPRETAPTIEADAAILAERQRLIAEQAAQDSTAVRTTVPVEADAVILAERQRLIAEQSTRDTAAATGAATATTTAAVPDTEIVITRQPEATAQTATTSSTITATIDPSNFSILQLADGGLATIHADTTLGNAETTISKMGVSAEDNPAMCGGSLKSDTFEKLVGVNLPMKQVDHAMIIQKDPLHQILILHSEADKAMMILNLNDPQHTTLYCKMGDMFAPLGLNEQGETIAVVSGDGDDKLMLVYKPHDLFKAALAGMGATFGAGAAPQECDFDPYLKASEKVSLPIPKFSAADQKTDISAFDITGDKLLAVIQDEKQPGRPRGLMLLSAGQKPSDAKIMGKEFTADQFTSWFKGRDATDMWVSYDNDTVGAHLILSGVINKEALTADCSFKLDSDPVDCKFSLTMLAQDDIVKQAQDKVIAKEIEKKAKENLKDQGFADKLWAKLLAEPQLPPVTNKFNLPVLMHKWEKYAETSNALVVGAQPSFLTTLQDGSVSIKANEIFPATDMALSVNLDIINGEDLAFIRSVNGRTTLCFAHNKPLPPENRGITGKSNEDGKTVALSATVVTEEYETLTHKWQLFKKDGTDVSVALVGADTLTPTIDLSKLLVATVAVIPDVKPDVGESAAIPGQAKSISKSIAKSVPDKISSDTIELTARLTSTDNSGLSTTAESPITIASGPAGTKVVNIGTTGTSDGTAGAVTSGLSGDTTERAGDTGGGHEGDGQGTTGTTDATKGIFGGGRNIVGGCDNSLMGNNSVNLPTLWLCLIPLLALLPLRMRARAAVRRK